MIVKQVEEKDKEFVMSIDQHVTDVTFHNRVFWEKDEPIGLMVHCILWDNLPVVNFLFIKEEYRNREYAREAMTFWENDMRQQGYKMVLISTQVDETSQHIYRKLGYVDCGSLLFDHTPMEQPMEMFMRKVL